MTSRAFQFWWSSRFGTNLPLGHVLRQAFPERWVRFRVLPGSERYPRSEAEYRVVLRREEALAADVLREDGPCWLVVPVCERPAPAEEHRELPEAPGLRLRRAMTGSVEGTDVTVWAARVTWRTGAFDAILRAIADDRLRALWASRTSPEAFAPYDGGVDVIAATPARRRALATKYAPWLPRTPGGM